MCLALGGSGLHRRTLLARLAQLGGGAAALTALGPVVWARSGDGPPLPTEVAGVKLPLSALVVKAAREVYGEEPPVIYFHSVRTFVLASLYADWVTPKLEFTPELVMIASLFHDIGLTPTREVYGRPFEIVSAEHARDFVVREGGFSERDADLIYRSIALHFGKALDEPEPEARLIQIGAVIDLFSKTPRQLGWAEFPALPEIRLIAGALPRCRFKTAFIEEQRAHVARTHDPGPVAKWVADPPPDIASSRWPE